MECVETSILPFEHVSKERFRQSGSTSSHVRAFQEAYKEASAEQLKDDDGLPSMDDVFSHLTSLPPTSTSPSLKDTVCQKTYAQHMDISCLFLGVSQNKGTFTPPKIIYIYHSFGSLGQIG